ncbi:MAG: asparaginase domain-containing protein, partial [bacterium]
VVLGMHETTSDTSVGFHRGAKVRKCHTSTRNAFQSVNAGPLARVVEGRVEMMEDDYRRRNDGPLEVMDGFEEKTALVKFHPGLQPKLVDWFVDEGYKGLILEGTGLGHVSTGLYDVIERAVEAGLYVGMTSQCIWGRLGMNVYTTGRALQRLGVEPLGDMLPETAYVKLMWALANSEDLEAAKALMRENIAGEYSDRTLYTGRFG